MKKIINVSHQHRCIFVHVPKAAGTSIKERLGLPGGGHPPWYFYVNNFPEIWQQYTSFTVVRNPWDRMVSAYCYSQLKESYWHNEDDGLHPDYGQLREKSFEDCVSILHSYRDQLKHESWHNQVEWLTRTDSESEKIMVDSILRFETIDEDFEQLCHVLNIKPGKLPTQNQTNRNYDYRSYYKDNTVKMIRSVYEKDIDLFGYTF